MLATRVNIDPSAPGHVELKVAMTDVDVDRKSN